MVTYRTSQKEGRLLASACLNFATTSAQIAGGLISGSLSLISDALHNFSDTAALVISFFAVRLTRRRNTEAQTFGYKRAEILAAFINASALAVISIFLFREAFVRFMHPRAINGLLMLGVALIGLFGNAVSVFLLRTHAHKDLNVRAAYLHLFSDFLSSIAVIAGAVTILAFGAYWVDPALTIIIGIYVLREGYAIIKESSSILMQHVPKGISLKDVQVSVERMEGVGNMHHAHLWAVTERDIHLEAHINVTRDMRVSETCVLVKSVEDMLKERYGITHVTLPIEIDSCKGVDLVKA